MLSYQKKLKEIDALKLEISAHRLLTKQELHEIRAYYRIGLTYASNAIEGNSLTETETKIVLEEGITIGGKLVKDHLEALGHADAYDALGNFIKKNIITERDILKLHKLFYQKIDPKKAGKYRKVQVFITGTDFVPPAPNNVPGQVKKLIKNLPSLKKHNHPVVFAALVHLHFVTIHPFIDGNGRCARLLMNLALLQAGYATTIIPPIVRAEYINALKKAQTSKKSDVFIEFIVRMVYEAQREYARLINALEPA